MIVQELYSSLISSLIVTNFLSILNALDETLLLLIISLPIGFVLWIFLDLNKFKNALDN